MSPELFNTYAHMRSRELRATAARERRVRSAVRSARDDRLARVRAWFAGPWAARRQVQSCTAC